MAVTCGAALTEFPGVGEARAKKLEKLGLSKAGDLLAWYPRDYEDRRRVHTIRDAPLEGHRKHHPRRRGEGLDRFVEGGIFLSQGVSAAQ